MSSARTDAAAPATPAQAPSPPSRAAQALKDFHEEGALGKAYDVRLMKRL
jgi:hypothetical protein